MKTKAVQNFYSISFCPLISVTTDNIYVEQVNDTYSRLLLTLLSSDYRGEYTCNAGPLTGSVDIQLNGKLTNSTMVHVRL